ncbi:STAS domain-containing protein [Streptomyces sp. NPDC018031]|uniref:STAS domain-containing protein n=1 Tax=Streptomyces sp. NPDC018031 TaxID=3365033 RepID=UPI0037BD0E21
MVLPRLDIHRRNRGEGAVVTLAGEIGPATAPLLRDALEQCLRDGVTVIDVDLTTVGSCDARGLDVLLSASRRASRVHASLQLHHPCTQITRLLAVTGSTPLLLPAPTAPVPPALPPGPVETASSGPPTDAKRTLEHTARGPVLQDGIRLRPLTRWQTEGMREDIADLDMASVADTPGESFHDRGRFLRRLAASARRPGFALLVAETTGLVGCAYGFPVGPDGSGGRGLDRMLRESIPPLTACARFLLLTQVVAHPHAQRRDIARRLQQRLLTDRRAALGVVLLHPADQTGQATFESWGWQNMGEVVGLPGPVAPCVLILPREGPTRAGR